MKNKFLSILFTGLTACSGQPMNSDQKQNSEGPYQWTRVVESASWKKSYNFQMLTVRDTLWTFHPDGNWYSVNGKDWTKSSLPNAIHNLAFLDYVAFNNSVLGLGHFEGNIERFTFKNEIYRTTDFKKWLTLSKSSNLPPRFFYHPFVFDNKLWIIGGEDKTTQYADIWNSPDGVAWTRQKENASFGKRSSSQVVLFKNKLFLLNNDVWSSSDALTWKLETNEIVPGENIFGYTAVVFDNRIWLLGCNRNGQFSSQVLVSENGKDWSGMEAPWSPRGGIAATVYKGKIVMTGGKYGGTPTQPEFIYSNDVWTLERKK